jgi:hypothetical protein
MKADKVKFSGAFGSSGIINLANDQSVPDERLYDVLKL